MVAHTPMTCEPPPRLRRKVGSARFFLMPQPPLLARRGIRSTELFGNPPNVSRLSISLQRIHTYGSTDPTTQHRARSAFILAQ